MAVVQNPIIGRARNAMGNAIFSTWKGINVLRSKPLHVANPRTPEQIHQRQKMKMGVEAFRPTAAVVRAGFVEQAIHMSEYNAFMSQFLLHGTEGSGANMDYDPEGIMFAKGSLPITSVLSAAVNVAPNEVVLVFSSTAAAGQSENDIPIAAVFNETTGEWGGAVMSDNERGDGSVHIENAVELNAGNLVHAWLAFISPDGRKASDSVLITETAA